MGEQSITTSPLLGWLRQWSEAWNAAKEAKPLLDALSRSPSEYTLASFFKLMRGSGRYSDLYQEYATNLWVMHRAENVNMWKGPDAAPQVYFDGPMLMAPAPPDHTTDVFRGTVAASIAQLLEREKVLIVFSRSIPEVRSFVAPELFRILRSKRIAPHYMRMYSRTEQPAENPPDLFRVAEKNIVLNSRGLNEGNATLRDLKGNTVVVIDLLEFADWFRQRSADWLFSYDRLIDNLNSSLLKRKGGRLVFFVKSDPFSYPSMWAKLVPFINKLELEQEAFLFVGILPQLATAVQAANYLGVNLSDARLMASRIPFLASSLVGIKLILEQSAEKRRNFDVVAANAAMRLPPSRVVIGSHNRFIMPNDAQRARFAEALRPTLAHEIFALTTDGRTLSGDNGRGPAFPPSGSGPQIDGFDPELISGAPFLYGPNIMNGASMMIAPVVTMPPMMTLLPSLTVR